MLTRQTFLSASWQVDASPAVRPAADSAAAYRWLDASASTPADDAARDRILDTEAAAAAAPAWRNFVADETLRGLVDRASTDDRGWRRIVRSVEAARAKYGAGPWSCVPDRHGSGRAGDTLAAFERDLLARLHDPSEAVPAELAIDDAAHGARVSLIAEIVRAYVIRDGAQRRYRLGTRMLEVLEASPSVIAARTTRGLADELDYQEAVGLVERAQLDLERIDRELRAAGEALAVLLGVTNAGECLPALPGTGTIVHDIAAGAPSELLIRRPDLRAAEWQLTIRGVGLDAARAAFFPRIALTGLFGRSSAELSDLFGPRRRAGSYAPREADLALARARRNVALAAYERSVRTALREVSDALAAADALRRAEETQRAVVVAGAAARRLAEERSRDGIDDRLCLLEARRGDLANRMALIHYGTLRQLALVVLFRVLGGGWHCTHDSRSPG